MHGEKHDLFHEFPEYQEKIRQLKSQDNHFAKLFDEYHEVNKEVRRIEQEIETPSDTYTEDLKKRRLHLKDEIYSILKQ